MPAVSSSASAVLIGAIAAATSTIRVGSGGVTFPNHSSLVIAEQFGTLSALHGGRIDLGLGRVPGTDQLASSVLRRGAGAESVDDFPNQVVELHAWFGTIPPLENGIGSRLVAVPGLVADDQADAERLALPNALTFVRMPQGARPARIPSLTEAEAYPWSAAEREWVAERNSQQAIGDLAQVSQRIAELVAVTDADEVIVAPQGPDLATKPRTLRDLAAWLPSFAPLLARGHTLLVLITPADRAPCRGTSLHTRGCAR